MARPTQASGRYRCCEWATLRAITSPPDRADWGVCVCARARAQVSVRGLHSVAGSVARVEVHSRNAHGWGAVSAPVLVQLDPAPGLVQVRCVVRCYSLRLFAGLVIPEGCFAKLRCGVYIVACTCASAR